MTDGTNNDGASAPAAPLEHLGLVGHIEKLFAETGDAALHGLRRLAAELEKIGHGGVEPAVLAELIEDKVASIVNPFLADMKEAFKGRVEHIEDQVTKLTAQLQGQPASAPPAAPPEQSTAVGVSVAGVEVPAGAGALTETAPASA